jgi:transposase-like protein
MAVYFLRCQHLSRAKGARVTRAAAYRADVRVRSCRYLNNIVEQDHRAIKRRCACMTGFKSFRNAAILIAGIELAHRIRKRQFSFGLGRQRRAWSLKQLWERALA